MRTLTGIVALIALLGGCGLPDDEAFEKMADAIAADVAHDTGTALANMSPGDYGEGGVSYLTANLEKQGATVLGSEVVDTTENGALQAWLDARFDFPDVQLEDPLPPVCLRFEVRWVYGGDYVTYRPLDCPA